MKMTLKALLSAVLTFSLLAVVEAPSAYAGPIYTFTNAGATGTTGPTQVQINSAYTGTSLAGSVTINTQGIQEWTVPVTGDYWVEFAGASGGYTPGALGGKGRTIKIQVTLTAGHLIKILVGQEGGRLYFTTGYAGGGGGGSYIYNATTSSFIGVAGGGGGAAQGNTSYVSVQPGIDAPTYSTTAGTSGGSYSGSYTAAQAGGTNGGAGAASSGGGSGAGISANGSAGSFAGGGGGTRFSAGGNGGANRIQNASATTNVEGGFGGGAGAGIWSNYDMVAGAGGGYSGGGGSGTRVGAGGAGGNFYTGTYLSSALNTGNGFVTFQLIADPTVTLATSGNARVAYKGEVLQLTATVDDTVKVTFFADGKRIPGCIGLATVAGTKYCNWRPTVQKSVSIYAAISQAGTVVATSQRISVAVNKRTGRR